MIKIKNAAIDIGSTMRLLIVNIVQGKNHSLIKFVGTCSHRLGQDALQLVKYQMKI
jgi:hypothetical protein